MNSGTVLGNLIGRAAYRIVIVSSLLSDAKRTHTVIPAILPVERQGEDTAFPGCLGTRRAIWASGSTAIVGSPYGAARNNSL